MKKEVKNDIEDNHKIGQESSLPIQVQTSASSNSNEFTNVLADFFITLCFGGLGIHKFIKGDTTMGFVYLFTGGLLGIGWLYDTVKAFIRLFNRK